MIFLQMLQIACCGTICMGDEFLRTYHLIISLVDPPPSFKTALYSKTLIT